MAGLLSVISDSTRQLKVIYQKGEIADSAAKASIAYVVSVISYVCRPKFINESLRAGVMLLKYDWMRICERPTPLMLSINTPL